MIAVFGSSEPQDGDPAYAVARRLGTLLAQAGHPIVTGAYGGVMEAASRGAREAGGGTVGVPCSIFGGRQPNPYVDRAFPTRDLFDRTRELIVRADGFVVLPGKSGTLAELAMLWALDRAGCLDGRPVVLLGSAWQALLDLLEREKMLEPSQLRNTYLTRSPAEAVDVLSRALAPPAEER